MAPYRQYEDPRALEKELQVLEEYYERKQNEGYELDDYDHEKLQSLRDRINFAWQDEEYDESFREPDEEF